MAVSSRTLPSENISLNCPGDDADVIVWNMLTGEKVQVVSCAFHGPVGVLVWIPEQPGLVPGFAFGCADGSIHIYQRLESSVSDLSAN